MVDSKPMSTPMESRLQLSSYDPSHQVNATIYQQMIGGLIYLTNTRRDIANLSRFM